MARNRMPIAQFVAQLAAALARGDGYIMGARGQDPRKWAEDSWWFTQYSGAQRDKALYWRAHAARVWDCNGLAEGIYEDYSGVNINTKARYNYANWCGVKGAGEVPASYRVPGTAVFWGDSAASIHHVAYLYAPVDAAKPEGDWYIIEARGVMYGVVKTRLNSRKPDYWGLMDKYFDYGDVGAEALHMGDRLLKPGSAGSDVLELQQALIRLGYELPRYGADGDYGSETVAAVKAFQRAHDLDADGEYGALTHAALERALLELDEDEPDVDPEDGQGDGAETKPPEPPGGAVSITGGNAWIRTGPGKQYPEAGVARDGQRFEYANPDAWVPVLIDDEVRWISGKYAKVVS